jgi:bifunctional non-homologous end joining protein LigD
MMPIYTTRLTNTVGRSFKEYNISLEAEECGVIVHYSHGRIGSSLVTGRKNESPIPLNEAMKIADRLIASKIKKGYVVESTSDNTKTFVQRDTKALTPSDVEISDSASDSARNTDFGLASIDTEVLNSSTNHIENQAPVFFPQLLNAVTPERASFIINDEWLETYFCQIKADGERRVVRVSSGQIEAYNKRGCIVQLNDNFANDVITLANEKDLLIDCEDMGDIGLYVFDVLEFNGIDYSSSPFENRVLALKEISYKADYARLSNIKVLMPVEVNCPESLLKAIDYSKSQNEEGIVLRKGSSIYAGGRPNKEGDVLKIKNTNSASVIVIDHTQNKRSVSIGLYNASNQLVDVGKVTIPPNKDIPIIGAVIEVIYLYVNGKQGALYQPVFKCDRSHEITKKECSTSQLVYKKESLKVA